MCASCDKLSSFDPAAISPVSLNDLSLMILRFCVKPSLTLNRRMDTKITSTLPITQQTWSVLSPQLGIVKVVPKIPTISTAGKEALSALLNDKFWRRAVFLEKS